VRPVANQELRAQLMRRKMLSNSALVFHTKSGKPLTHLWEDTQAIFKKAKLDMSKAHPPLLESHVLHHVAQAERTHAGHHGRDCRPYGSCGIRC